MTRLVTAPEPEREFTATLADGTRFTFVATYRQLWAKAEDLAFGVPVRRIERHTALSHFVEERVVAALAP